MKKGDYNKPCTDYSQWKIIMQEELSGADSFDIHCWNEETECIRLALQYGSKKEFDWRYGQVISGAVTPQFIHWLVDIPKPTDTEIYDKMTPFFSIFFNTGFSSEHYGTELTKY